MNKKKKSGKMEGEDEEGNRMYLALFTSICSFSTYLNALAGLILTVGS